jgi:D-arabinose 1-dehydrogenase-like Zn-dependent alcohol dehydrogenase
LPLAAEIPIKPKFQEYGLEEANKALLELKKGKIPVPRCCGLPD